MKPLIVTTSWDDGHRLDIKLAQLLSKYSLPATLYIAPANHEFAQNDLLTSAQIHDLSAHFEIGAHTMTHPELTAISLMQVGEEMRDSKKKLEEIIAKPVRMFCYPRGKFNHYIELWAQKCGFIGARSVNRFQTTIQNRYAMDTTVHAYTHFSDIFPILKYAHFNPFKALFLYLSWDNLAIDMFDRLQDTGGVFHLWGHSWEVENRKEWNKLERVCKHIAHRNNVEYLTNSQVIESLEN